MKSRHMIIGVAICGWCGVLVGLALLGRIKDVNSQPDEHAFWHLATAACLGLTFVAFLIFSKRRFLIASLVSLMAATAIGALWIASMWVYLGFSIGGTTPIVVSGTKYAETKSLAVWIARGGISVEFNIIAAIWDDSEQNFKPTDWSKLDYIRAVGEFIIPEAFITPSFPNWRRRGQAREQNWTCGISQDLKAFGMSNLIRRNLGGGTTKLFVALSARSGSRFCSA